MLIRSILAAYALSVSVAAQAGVVVGGSSLLGSNDLSQLETWLDQGQLTLTNIFTKSAGAGASEFHAAVDGKGPTFTLMEASEDGGTTWKLIGGYNPQSWGSGNYYNQSPDQSTWKAFLFNLTDDVLWSQSYDYQTYNWFGYGPTFGGGHDLYVDSSLGGGYSYRWSYGGLAADGSIAVSSLYGTSLVDGSQWDGLSMQVRGLEVLTVGAYVPPDNDVPEPGSVLLLGAALIALGAARRQAGR